MKFPVSRINLINGEYVLEKFYIISDCSDDFCKWSICKKYREDSTVLLALASFSNLSEAISNIHSADVNFVYYGAIHKVVKVVEIEKEGYVEFTYDDGYVYAMTKEFLERNWSDLYELYLNSKKTGKIEKRDKL